MPALPRHHLSLVILPPDPDAPGGRAAPLLAAWAAAGFGLGPGPGRALVEGGVRRVRAVEEPVVRFVANRQGGFRVRCPRTGENVVGAFSDALERWRAGGPRRLQCPCGVVHDLDQLDFAPGAGFGRSWAELVDVGSAELVTEATRIVEEVWGPSRLVWRRG